MAKLSSRELAVKAKKKATLSMAPKVAKPAYKAPVATGPAVGPLMTGQVRANSGPAVGPLLTGQTRNETSTRDMAAKAQAKKSTPKNTGLSGGEGLTFGQPSGLDLNSAFKSGGLTTGTPQKSSGGGLTGSMSDIMGSFGEASVNRGLGMASDNTFLTDAERGQNARNLFGIGTAKAETSFIDGQNQPTGESPTTPMTTSPWGEAGDLISGEGRMTNDQYEQNMFSGGGVKTNTKKPWTNPWGNVDISGESSPVEQPMSQDEYSQYQNELNGGGPGPVDTAGSTTGNRSGRGSGMFGTGKGVGSPANEDSYIKELRKAYSSNGGEKWLRKQFEELIAALDPTYAQMQKEGTDALNAQLNTDNTKLASVMNANNTGDSEQRAQMMAQQQQGTQTAIGALLAKLAQAKAGDVSQYKSSMAEKMGQLQERNQSNKQRLMEQIQQYRNRQEDQAYKNASLARKGGGKVSVGFKSFYDPINKVTKYSYTDAGGNTYNVSADEYNNGKYGPIGSGDGGNFDPANMSDEELRAYYNNM